MKDRLIDAMLDIAELASLAAFVAMTSRRTRIRGVTSGAWGSLP